MQTSNSFQALGALALFMFVCLAYRFSKNYVRLAMAAALVILAFVIGTHRWPGFPSWSVIEPVVLSSCSTAFRWRLHLDKLCLALILWLTLIRLRPPRVRSSSFARLSIYLGLGVLVLLLMSWALGYIHWSPGAPPYWIGWLAAHLIFTVVPEEILFRGFILHELENAMSKTRIGSLTALGVSSLVFGLAHLGGGPLYAILATSAGLFYGVLWQKGGSLVWPISAHFAVNALHFLLFTYPAWNGVACA